MTASLPCTCRASRCCSTTSGTSAAPRRSPPAGRSRSRREAIAWPKPTAFPTARASRSTCSSIAARVADHARDLAETGAVGCNFEDQEVGGPGLHPIAEQAHRVAAVVESGLWVNARTDLFLRKLIAGENANDRSLLGEALERAQAYAEAGAHSFFVPGITDLELIAEICAAAPLPVNVIKPAEHDFPALAAAGVARISWGPRPWIWAMARLTEEAQALYAAR